MHCAFYIVSQCVINCPFTDWHAMCTSCEWDREPCAQAAQHIAKSNGSHNNELRWIQIDWFEIKSESFFWLFGYVLTCVCDRDNIASHLNKIGSICFQMWHNSDTIISFNCNHIDWPAWWINFEIKRLHGLSLTKAAQSACKHENILGKRIHVWPKEQFFYFEEQKGLIFKRTLK